ncbi:MAG: hypothetical protein DYG96_13160 [Chlorobi bacterium CHB2]|nr:hypothetical protein [Chlorobi bacterium CHB2]
MLHRADRLLRCFLLLLGVVGGSVVGGPAAAAQTHDEAAEAPPHGRCLTFVLTSETERKKLSAELQGASSALNFDGSRPFLPFSVPSRNNHFLIHYTQTGADAVSKVDNNANGVPDYIDSVDFYMEYAWQIEIEEYGFQAPPPDNQKSGEGGPDSRLDVYVCNMPSGFYGAAFPETQNQLSDGRVPSFLVVDNDYDPAVYKQTSGIAALRVTTAHEFNHMVQFGYRCAIAPLSTISQKALYEATSVWFERVVHPDVDDYEQYTDAFLEAPQKYGFATNEVDDGVTGYAHMLYLEYLSKQFGKSVVREIWEEFRSRESLSAIDAALRKRSFNLQNSWCQFAEWCYYTGKRARDTQYFYDAATLNRSRGMRTAATASLSSGAAMASDLLYPLSFGLYRLVIPTENPNVRDTVDYMVTNAKWDIANGAGGPGAKLEEFTLESDAEERSGFTAITAGQDTVVFYKLTLPHQHFCINPIVNGSKTNFIAVKPSPQPFVADGGNQLVFAVERTDQLIKNIKVWIYSTAATRVRELEQTELQGANNLLGVVWDGRDNAGRLVPTGVYLYEISVNGGTPTLGKVAVIAP